MKFWKCNISLDAQFYVDDKGNPVAADAKGGKK